jgi:hypothetical protein
MNEVESQQLNALAGWLASLGEDSAHVAEFLDACLAKPSGEADRAVAEPLVGALSYVLKSLTLIPDGAEDLGFLEDALVLRAAAARALEAARENGLLAEPTVPGVADAEAAASALEEAAVEEAAVEEEAASGVADEAVGEESAAANPENSEPVSDEAAEERALDLAADVADSRVATVIEARIAETGEDGVDAEPAASASADGAPLSGDAPPNETAEASESPAASDRGEEVLEVPSANAAQANALEEEPAVDAAPLPEISVPEEPSELEHAGSEPAESELAESELTESELTESELTESELTESELGEAVPARSLDFTVVRSLASDAPIVEALLGAELPRLGLLLTQLRGLSVRGRSVAEVLEDAAARSALLGEIQSWAESYLAPVFPKDEKSLVKLRSFLRVKLPRE